MPHEICLMNKLLVFSIFAVLFSCISPDEIAISADPDAAKLDFVLKSVSQIPEGTWLKKEVTLNDQKELLKIPYDTAVIQEDLKPLTEFSFAHLIRPSNYKRVSLDQGILFERRVKEKKGPISVLIKKNDQKDIATLEVKFENENYLYQSNQTIVLEFEDRLLTSYLIFGSRKLIGLDPSSFQVKVNVIL